MRNHQDRGGGYRRPEWAPEARQERPQSAAVPPPASISVEPTIHVSGCSNETVSNIIQGVYTTKESNHGKPVYKKDGLPGSVTVLIYYWDSRDGPSFNGWWFGPKVGGDQVWAYNAGHPGRDHPGMPPTSNWKVPWDGKVDERLRITREGPDRREEDRRRQERQRQEKRRREEELQREEERRREEARRRRQREEEAERRRREEDRKHEAVGNVRKVLKKLRTATPSNIKELQAELDRVAADNLKAMGDLRETVNHEMQDTLTQAQSRIQEELKQREEAQRRREAELQRVQGLVKEAAGEVDSVEAAVAEAAARCATAGGLAPETPWRELLEAVAQAIKDLDAAKASLERSETILNSKKEAMGAGEAARSVKKEVDELSKRLQSSKDTVTKCSKTLEESRGRGLRRAAAEKQRQDWESSFARHDLDGDGCLSRAEVEAFGKGEFEIALPEDVLDHIMRVLEPISFEKFLSLRQKVGIAKFEVKAREARERKRQRSRSRDEAEGAEGGAREGDSVEAEGAGAEGHSSDFKRFSNQEVATVETVDAVETKAPEAHEASEAPEAPEAPDPAEASETPEAAQTTEAIEGDSMEAEGGAEEGHSGDSKSQEVATLETVDAPEAPEAQEAPEAPDFAEGPEAIQTTEATGTTEAKEEGELMEAEGGGAATAETVDAVETKAPEALDPAEH